MWTAPECWTREASEALVRRYHAGLEAAGVANYPVDRCLADFRGSVLDNLRTPISQLMTPQVPEYVPRQAHLAAVALIEAWDAGALLD